MYSDRGMIAIKNFHILRRATNIVSVRSMANSKLSTLVSAHLFAFAIQFWMPDIRSHNASNFSITKVVNSNANAELEAYLMRAHLIRYSSSAGGLRLCVCPWKPPWARFVGLVFTFGRILECLPALLSCSGKTNPGTASRPNLLTPFPPSIICSAFIPSIPLSTLMF